MARFSFVTSFTVTLLAIFSTLGSLVRLVFVTSAGLSAHFPDFFFEGLFELFFRDAAISVGVNCGEYLFGLLRQRRLFLCPAAHFAICLVVGPSLQARDIQKQKGANDMTGQAT
jgi:hypothetical protein